MSSQITTAFVQQYNANVFHLSQQKGSKLRNNVRVEMQKGKAAYYDRIGAVSVVERVSRHGDTPQLDTPHSRRRVTLKDYEWADLIDNQDKIRTLIDPTNDYAMAAANAMGRQMDSTLLAAALGNAYGAEDGSSTVALGSAQRVQAVAGAAASNLNVLALRKAKLILDSADVDPSLPRYCAINASGLENLLSQTEVTNSDYNIVKALVQGEVDTFMGFKFILTNLCPALSVAFQFDTATGLSSGSGTSVAAGAAGYYSMVCWAQDGLMLSLGEDMTSKISERGDKGYSTQVYSRMSIGATRLEEAKVVEIIAKQA